MSKPGKLSSLFLKKKMILSQEKISLGILTSSDMIRSLFNQGNYSSVSFATNSSVYLGFLSSSDQSTCFRVVTCHDPGAGNITPEAFGLAGSMGIMICLGQGSLRSPSASSLI